MTALLTDQLALISTASNGVRKLRELILQLAIMGKLVPQDRSDEPVSALLKRIEAERLKKVDIKEIKAQAIDPQEMEFALPPLWQWATLSELAENIQYGYTASANYSKESVRMLRITDIQNDKVNWNSVPGCAIEAKQLANYTLSNGDILIARTGGTIGKSYLVENLSCEAIFASYLIRLKRLDSTFPPYVKLFLGSSTYWRQLKAKSMGTGQPNVNGTSLKSLLIPIPPLAEQHRIVAKVDELMTLCDRLEAQQLDAESEHSQFVKILLDSLTQSTDHTDFAASWERIKENFDTIFSTESSIDALKQTLLQLAVMGRLVPQDSKDEPASELLKKIQAEKVRQFKKGEIGKEKTLEAIKTAEIPYHVPPSWAWSKVGDYSAFTEYGISEKTFELQDGIPVIKMGDIQGGRVILNGQKKVDRKVEVILLKHHDLLYNRTNSAELVGKTGLFEGPDDEYTFASYLIRIQCLPSLSCPNYLNLAMNTPGFRATQILPQLKQQCGQANVNGTILKNMLVPIPPLAEQHRIVAKVDELMALCNSLKAALQSARSLQESFASEVIEKAVTGTAESAAMGSPERVLAAP
jgi:type I restriction enzyme S subunit